MYWTPNRMSEWMIHALRSPTVAVSHDKDSNTYCIRSVLEVPNGMGRATPQPWACAEILRSANVRSLRALWKSRLGCAAEQSKLKPKKPDLRSHCGFKMSPE